MVVEVKLYRPCLLSLSAGWGLILGQKRTGRTQQIFQKKRIRAYTGSDISITEFSVSEIVFITLRGGSGYESDVISYKNGDGLRVFCLPHRI